MNESDKSGYQKLPFEKSLAPEDKAVISKLVKDPKQQNSSRRRKALDIPQTNIVSKLAVRTASSINDAKNQFQLLPDMDLARSTLVSAVLSPHDLVSTELLYSMADNDLDDNLTGPILRLVKGHFETGYKIKKLLPEMLSDALFMKGSYPLLVLPESTIDHSINSSGRVSIESLGDEVDTATGWYRPYGLLGVPDNSGKYNSSMEGFGAFSLDQAELNRKATKDSYKVIDSLPGIKVSTESGTQTTSKEYKLKGAVHITDNPNVLKNPALLDKLRSQRVAEVYGARTSNKGKLSRAPAGTTTADDASLEGKPLPLAGPQAKGARLSPSQTENMFFTNRQYQTVPVVPLLTPKQLDRENVGHPLVMNLPSESVIPIHVPGNPRQHVAYFVLLDMNGNPLSITYRDDYYSDIRNTMSRDPDMTSYLTSMNIRAQNGRVDWNVDEINEMQQAYNDTVDSDLINRLRSGAMTGDYEISRVEEAYRLMFSRSLAGKNTMMLYVPVELMTYIAFNYNDYGIGKSMLEDGKILASIRSTLLLAGTIAAVKNATGTQTITIDIPEEDEDPYGTVEFMLGEYAKVNRDGFPIGETHPVDIISGLQNAGKNIVLQGNTAFPEAKFNVEAREGSQKQNDRELEEDLRKRHIQLFGLTPEMLDGINGPDFATTIVQQSLMLLKRVVAIQDVFCPFLEDFHRTYILQSGTLLDEIRQLIKDNKKYLPEEFKSDIDGFIYEVIQNLVIELPKPKISKVEDQMQGFDAYTDAITKGIEAYINSASLEPMMAQGLEEHLDAVKATILASYQRKWLRDNNVLSELDVFGTVTEDEGPAFNLLEETELYADGVLKGIEGYLKKALKTAKQRAKRVNKDIKAVIDEIQGAAAGSMDDDGLGGMPGDDAGGIPGEDGGIPGEDGGLPGEGGDAELGADGLPADDGIPEVPGEPGADGMDAMPGEPGAEPGDVDAAAAAEGGAGDVPGVSDVDAAPAEPGAEPAALDAELPAGDEAAGGAEVPEVPDLDAPVDAGGGDAAPLDIPAGGDAAPAAEPGEEPATDVPEVPDVEVPANDDATGAADAPPSDAVPPVSDTGDQEVGIDVPEPPAEEPPAADGSADVPAADAVPEQPAVDEPPAEDAAEIPEVPADDAPPAEDTPPVEEAAAEPATDAPVEEAVAEEPEVIVPDVPVDDIPEIPIESPEVTPAEPAAPVEPEEEDEEKDKDDKK